MNFDLKTDFGTIRTVRTTFYPYPSDPRFKFLPGASGNYFTTSPMKKTKKVKPTIRSLQKRIKRLETNNNQLTESSYANCDKAQTLQTDLDKVTQQLRLSKETYHQTIKAVGLYFAAIDAERATDENTVAYLRKLRSAIFSGIFDISPLP